MQLKFLADRLRICKEFVIPEVIEAFLSQLEPASVPSNESLPASFARTTSQFRNQKVERAFISMQGLGNAFTFMNNVRFDESTRSLLKYSWPGILAWLYYFYEGCFERNLTDESFRDNMESSLNEAFTFPAYDDDLAIVIRKTPGTIRLATLLYMLESRASYVNDVHRGSTILFQLLKIPGLTHAFDEVVATLDGNATLIVKTALARIDRSIPTAMMHLSLLMSFEGLPQHHPLSRALRPKTRIEVPMKIIHSLMDFTPNSTLYLSESPLNAPHCIAACFSNLVELLPKGSNDTKPALQVLQAGVLSALATCASQTSFFSSDDRKPIIHLLETFTMFSVHIGVARQVSAELERLGNTLSIQGRINASVPDVRKAWTMLYETICARREILAQMQRLNSTPMTCDNVRCMMFMIIAYADDHTI